MNKYGVETNLSLKEYEDNLETIYSHLNITEQKILTNHAKHRNITTMQLLNEIYIDFIKNRGVFPE